jgi:hypothetical protein
MRPTQIQAFDIFALDARMGRPDCGVICQLIVALGLSEIGSL